MTSNLSAHTLPLQLTLLFLVALVSSTSTQPPPLLARSGTLQVMVPLKPSFKEFVECTNDTTQAKGFTVSVFKSALDILVPKPNWTDVNYTCYYISNSDTYDAMVQALHSEKDRLYDAVVGDITISASRLETANFTQPYLDSGIVVVTPAKRVSPNFPGVFFVPFTVQTWVIIIASMASTGLTLWLLECGNPYLQRSESRSEKFKKVFWFVMSILVFFKRESITNPLAKFVMIAWILLILLLSSGYTASFSSILTVDQLTSESLNLTDILNGNLPVGYQSGSIVYDYLERWYNIQKLVPLNSADEYAEALHNKTVVAIVDEIPYISSFLAAQSASDCEFAVSSKLTIEGFGFAFYDKTLADAFSVAILELSESGELQKLQDGLKLSNYQCPLWVQSASLDLESSEGLFLLLGSTLLCGIGIYVLKHLLFPLCARTLARKRVNPRQDAVHRYWEPNFVGSIRRRFSARHHISCEELSRL